MKLFAVLSVLLSFVQMAFAQGDDIQIRTTHVAGSVHMLEGYGGNIAVSVGSDGILMVDAQFTVVSEKIRTALVGLSDGPLRFVVNTHFHPDHTDGNKVFGTEAIVVAHENTRERLSTPQTYWGETQPAYPEHAWPVITFDDDMTIYFNGEQIQVIYLPNGHTDTDAVVYFSESNVLHVGDQIFTDHFPFIDLEHGGTVDGYVRNVEAIAERFPDNVMIVCGHGRLATMDDLKAFHGMLVDTVRIVRGRMSDGYELDASKAAGLPEAYASYDWDFVGTEDWIETVYENYSN